MRSADTVIIIADPEDVHAGTVAHEIDRLGMCRVMILAAGDFPQRWSIAFDAKSESPARFRVNTGAEDISEASLAAVWYRRISHHRIDSPFESARVFARAEARALFESWLHCLGNRVINPRAAEAIAIHKPVQLAAAARVGLRIPETLATNNPELAEQFVANIQETIFKTFTATRMPVILPTRRFSSDLFAELLRLRLAPAIFQERIRRQFDVRATVVKDEVFAVRIDTDDPSAELDWRLDGNRSICSYDLPTPVAERLVSLHRELGLRFGACDLAVTPDGEHVFYEVNPAGQFLFAEIHGAVPISAAMAKALSFPSWSDEQLRPH